MASKRQIEDLKIVLEDRKAKISNIINESRTNIDQLKGQEINDDLDYAELVSDSFTEGMIANHQVNELRQIEDALIRINNNKYGNCDMCGITIPIGRLKAKPFARYCTECREVYENEEQGKGE